jgi:hypothetical protein
MRKKQPSRQAYARHVVGQSGSSSSRDEERGSSRIEATSWVEGLDRGKVPLLSLRLSLSKEAEAIAVRFVVVLWRVGIGTNGGREGKGGPGRGRYVMDGMDVMSKMNVDKVWMV